MDENVSVSTTRPLLSTTASSQNASRLGLWLITIGIVHFVAAFDDDGHRLMAFAIAVLEVIAGIVIVSSPGIGVATLALLVGISLILRGIAMCAVAWATRSVLHGHGAAPTSAAPA